jgi:hypothetical protein
LEVLKIDDMEDRRGSSSTKATLEYALRLAHEQLEGVKGQDEELDDTANYIWLGVVVRGRPGRASGHRSGGISQGG